MRLLTCALPLLFSLPLSATDYKAYVALCCATPATISVIDTATGATTSQIPTAVGAALMAPSPDYRTLYVLTQQFNGIPGEPWGMAPGGVNSVVITDLTGGPSNTIIPLAAMPFAIAFSPGGAKVYIAALDATYGSHLLIIDPQTKTVVRDQTYPSAKFGPGIQLVPSPDGSVIYMQTYAGESIWKIDAGTLAITQRLACSPYCQGLALAEQSKTLLTVAAAATVNYIDAATFKVNRQVPWPLPAGDYVGWVIPVSPDGATAYFGSQPFTGPTGSLSALNIAAGTFGPVITGMGIDYTAAVSPNGAYLVTDSQPVSLALLNLLPGGSGQPDYITTLSAIGSAFFSPTGDRVYVLNMQSSYVAEIDPQAGQPTARIPAGNTPVALAAQPGKNRVYVANQGSNVLSVIDTTTAKSIRNYAIPWTGWYPHGVAAAGDRVFVASLETLQMLDLASGAFTPLNVPNIGRYPLYRGLAASPDGRSLYMAFTTVQPRGTSGVAEGVDVYDPGTGKLLSQIAIARPEQVAFSADSESAYVGSVGQVTLIDSKQQKVARIIPVPALQETAGIAPSPDGKTLYLLDGLGSAVLVVDLASNSTVTSIPVGANASSLAISPDGALIYVTHKHAPALTVIGTATNTVTGSIHVGVGSNAVLFTN